jgi:hypothetical protein
MADNTGSNMLEGIFVFWSNGNYLTPPVSNMPTFGDIPIAQIVYVRFKQLPNINGTLINAFQVFVNNPKAIGNTQGLSELWIQAQNFLPSLQALQTYLNTSGINPVNSFSLYSGLLQVPIPFQAVGDYQSGILLNDNFTMLPRKYHPEDPNSPNGTGVTYLKLNVINPVEYLQIMVNGDQTSSGGYYYSYYN